MQLENVTVLGFRKRKDDDKGSQISTSNKTNVLMCTRGKMQKMTKI